MIFFNEPLRVFLEHNPSEIKELLFKKLLNYFHEERSIQEQASWEGTVIFLQGLFREAGLPEDMGVALEYNIPGKDLRVDCILTGKDSGGKLHAVLIEMKGWVKAELCPAPGRVRTYLAGAKRDEPHPSLQVAWYAQLLESNQSAVWEGQVEIHPCALLYNCTADKVIHSPVYSEYTSQAPAFCKGEVSGFLEYIRKFINTGDEGEALRMIDGGRRELSNKLSDAITAMLEDKDFFPLSPEQQLAVESIIRAVEYQEEKRNKIVLVVQGGPGTGKSVIAIRALCTLLQRTKNNGTNQQIRYITKTRPPRALIKNTLIDAHIEALSANISYPSYGVFNGGVHVALVDEAHRLDGSRTDQVDLIVRNSDVSVFFTDPRQVVSVADIGTMEHIRAIAVKYKAIVKPPYPLSVNFRVAITPSIESLLQYPGSVRVPLPSREEYDFRVYDDPMEMYKDLKGHETEGKKSRMVAGYTRLWKSLNFPDEMDWTLAEKPEFQFQWNMDEATEENNWATRQGLDRIGCIHSCQGMEFDYIGVIISKDISLSERGVLEFHPEMHAAKDPALRNFCRPLSEMSTEDAKRISEILRNTYFVLLTRGIKGCYVYVEGERNDPRVIRMMGYLRKFEQNRRK